MSAVQQSTTLKCCVKLCCSGIWWFEVIICFSTIPSSPVREPYHHHLLQYHTIITCYRAIPSSLHLYSAHSKGGFPWKQLAVGRVGSLKSWQDTCPTSHLHGSGNSLQALWFTGRFSWYMIQSRRWNTDVMHRKKQIQTALLTISLRKRCM